MYPKKSKKKKNSSINNFVMTVSKCKIVDKSNLSLFYFNGNFKIFIFDQFNVNVRTERRYKNKNTGVFVGTIILLY